MNNQEKIQIKTAENPDVVHYVDESRRSFSKKGLIAPVIMTLANRSAWGANACVGSGFQSYAAAVRNGVVLSHSTPDNSGTSEWRSPQKWFDDIALWTSLGFFPVRRFGTGNNFEVYMNGGFKPKNDNTTPKTYYKKREVLDLGLGVAFADEIPVATYTLPLYDAFLASTSNLRSYQIATAMNMMVQPLISPPDFSSFTRNDYVLFYDKCVD